MNCISRLSSLPPIVSLLLLLGGCSEPVPQGHVGKVLASSGWNATIAEPGYVTCWGRDQLYLLETGDHAQTEKLNVLCADRLNFRCDLVVVIRAKTDEASRTAIFGRIKAKAADGGRATIAAQQLYDTYVKPVVIPSAYDIVSKRETDQIGGDMVRIKREIVELCRERMADDLPVDVMLVDFTNTDYPEMVTTANEIKKKKEIDIEIAHSDAAIEEARAEGRLRAANKEYQAQLLEAKMLADANRIIGESLTDNPLFLYWHQIKVYGEAAKGPNNVFIVPYDAMGPGQGGMLNSVLLRDGADRNSDKNVDKSSAKQRGEVSPEYTATLERLRAAQQAADAAEQRGRQPRRDETAPQP